MSALGGCRRGSMRWMAKLRSTAKPEPSMCIRASHRPIGSGGSSSPSAARRRRRDSPRRERRAKHRLAHSKQPKPSRQAVSFAGAKVHAPWPNDSQKLAACCFPQNRGASPSCASLHVSGFCRCHRKWPSPVDRMQRMYSGMPSQHVLCSSGSGVT